MRSKSTNRPFKLLFLFLIVFIFSLTYIDWSAGIIHAGGIPILKSMLASMIHPDISGPILLKALDAT